MKQVRFVAWSLSAIVSAVAVIAWGQLYSWQFAGMGTYQLFPLFGLLAFSLMWVHYIASVIRQYFKIEKDALADYFEVTSGMVLVLILAHPGLLAWQLWRDGFGLPLGSYKAFVGPTLYGAVLLGVLAWLVFIAYEFRRNFHTRSWWKFIEYASDGAMILILIHSLRLGSHLQQGWFKGVWYFYGLTLAGSLVYIYIQKRKQLQQK